MPWLQHHRLFRSLGVMPAAETEAGGCREFIQPSAIQDALVDVIKNQP